MNVARISVLTVALVAGGLAFMLSRGQTPPAVKLVQSPPTETVDILVAREDIGVGRAVGGADLAWQPWPERAAGPIFIRRTARPNAIEELDGAVARSPFVAGEPIREQKLILAGGSGFMSAMLPAGMRAMSTEINAESGASGFILPNDHVDLVLTRDSDGAFVSETVLRNIRVLAIDQTVEEKDGQKVVVGRTATLELTSRQVETLTLSRRRGSLSLALRSLADARPARGETDEEEDSFGNVNFVRYGVTTVQMAR
jgi:pilus assembly protein CpaB